MYNSQQNTQFNQQSSYQSPQSHFNQPSSNSPFQQAQQPQQHQFGGNSPSWNTNSSTSSPGFINQLLQGPAYPQFGGSAGYANSNQQQQHPQQPQFGAGGMGGSGMNSSMGGVAGGGIGSLGGGGGASQGTPKFGEKANKRNYLPGYLSGGAMPAEPTPPQSGGDDSRAAWDSPASVHRNSISGSPAGMGSRFGNQSMLGSTRDGTPSRSPKMSHGRDLLRAGLYRGDIEEDAPPIQSLGEMDDSMTSMQGEPLQSTSSHEQHASSTPDRFPASSTSQPHHPTPAPAPGYSINIFGFPASANSFVLSHFGQLGEIIKSVPSPEGGNWVTITYEQPSSAIRATRRNGEVLGGVLMVGVKAVDEEILRGIAGEEIGMGNENGANPVGTNGSGTATPARAPSGLGKHVNVLGPSSAFKVAAPTPPRRGFFSAEFFGGAAPEAGGVDPHASLFVEKNRQAVLAQDQGAPKGVLGKVSDAIFGW